MTSVIPASETPISAPLSVDVWLDIACPWCALGERRLDRALNALPFGDEVALRFRSYQIAPDAPERATMKQPEFLASRGMDMTRFRSAQQQLVDSGAELGFHFSQDDTIPSNTHTAHRLIQAAGEIAGAAGSKRPGLQVTLVAALFSAYFEQGQDLGDHDALRKIATSAGLSAAEADRVLTSPTLFSEDVAADIAEAARLGISGVPFTVIDGRYGISGAQPEDAILRMLSQVHEELAAGGADSSSDGDASTTPNPTTSANANAHAAAAPPENDG